MKLTATMTTGILAALLSFSVLAEQAAQPSAAVTNAPAEQAAVIPAATTPEAAATTESQEEAPTTGWGWGGGCKQGRMEMMHKHMQKMEGHLINIEGLLKQLVEKNTK